MGAILIMKKYSKKEIDKGKKDRLLSKKSLV